MAEKYKQWNEAEMFSTSEAAKRLGVGATTVRKYLREGRLPEVPRFRKGAMIQRGFTDEWAERAVRILSGEEAFTPAPGTEEDRAS